MAVLAIDIDRVRICNTTPYLVFYTLMIVPAGTVGMTRMALGAAGAVARGEAKLGDVARKIARTVFGI